MLYVMNLLCVMCLQDGLKCIVYNVFAKLTLFKCVVYGVFAGLGICHET